MGLQDMLRRNKKRKSGIKYEPGTKIKFGKKGKLEYEPGAKVRF